MHCLLSRNSRVLQLLQREPKKTKIQNLKIQKLDKVRDLIKFRDFDSSRFKVFESLKFQNFKFSGLGFEILNFVLMYATSYILGV